MQKYLQSALHKFQHPAPKRPQHAPHSWAKQTYGAHVQYAPDDDASPLLPAKKTNLVQKIVGALLYYSIAVDPTMLTTLGSIAAHYRLTRRSSILVQYKYWEAALISALVAEPITLDMIWERE